MKNVNGKSSITRPSTRCAVIGQWKMWRTNCRQAIDCKITIFRLKITNRNLLDHRLTYSKITASMAFRWRRLVYPMDPARVRSGKLKERTGSQLGKFSHFLVFVAFVGDIAVQFRTSHEMYRNGCPRWIPFQIHNFVSHRFDLLVHWMHNQFQLTYIVLCQFNRSRNTSASHIKVPKPVCPLPIAHTTHTHKRASARDVQIEMILLHLAEELRRWPDRDSCVCVLATNERMWNVKDRTKRGRSARTQHEITERRIITKR